MDALRPEDSYELTIVRGRRSRALLPDLAPADGVQAHREWAGPTSALLADLSETCLRQLGEDPLGRFDTRVAFIPGRRCVLEADTERRLIVLSEASIAAVEFAVANAALTNLVRRIRLQLQGSSDRPELAEALEGARTALYATFQARLLLHAAGERSVPPIAPSLPDRYRVFVHEQLALCLSFALLHEQAHIEFAGGAAIDVGGLEEVGRFAPADDGVDQLEEHAGDVWAVRQFGAAGRARMAKAASLFFLSQWFCDYVSYSRDGSHPPAFDRLQYVVRKTGELRNQDPTLSEIMLETLNEQHALREAIDRRERADRYAKALRYARRVGGFRGYSAMMEAVCRLGEPVGQG